MIQKMITVQGQKLIIQTDGDCLWSCELFRTTLNTSSLKLLKDAIKEHLNGLPTVEPILLERFTTALKSMLSNSKIKLTQPGKKWLKDNDYNHKAKYAIHNLNANEEIDLYDMKTFDVVYGLPQEFLLV